MVSTILKPLILIVFLIGMANGDYGGSSDVYNKIINQNTLVQPYNHITIGISFDLSAIVDVDTKNQIMTVRAGLNLHWRDASLAWTIKQYPNLETVYLPSSSIWTPNIKLWNALDDSFLQAKKSGEVSIGPMGNVHMSVFGTFKTLCTIDVTYYPFDQQTCVFKFGPLWPDQIRIGLHNGQDEIDLSEFYPSVTWNVIEAPAYLNVYKMNVSSRVVEETDVTYYLTIRRKTILTFHILPFLAWAFISFLPCFVSNFLTKLILHLSCLAGLFTMYKGTIFELPPTSLVYPHVAYYLVCLIVMNMIHLTLTCLLSLVERKRVLSCTKWVPKGVWDKFDKLKKAVRESTKSNSTIETGGKQQGEIEESGPIENQTGTIPTETTEIKDEEKAEKVWLVLNVLIFLALLLGVVIVTLEYLYGHPHSGEEVVDYAISQSRG